jgi:methionine-gamma-lyase
MVKPFPSKTHIGNHMLHPETLLLNYGYDPQLTEGAVKPPVFLTSTFVFKTAEDGQDFFDYVSGRRAPPRGNGRRLGLFAVQPPEQRDRRGQAFRLRTHR